MDREEFAHRLEVRANIIREAQREREIYERGVNAIAELEGVQPCSSQDCSVRAEYFSTYSQYCEKHLAIPNPKILEGASA
jgi:hypothetical protein